MEVKIINELIQKIVIFSEFTLVQPQFMDRKEKIIIFEFFKID